jgi:triphosphoribosyl-dephospho-CoA synthase
MKELVDDFAVLDGAPAGSAGIAADVATDAAADRLANLVVAALIDEATLSPKPGLVDIRGRGAHSDLDWLLMCHSAWALQPSFRDMATAGRTIADPQTLRDCIGRIGREGEAAMMQATGGVNTHRGAIWALGLLVTAAAQDMNALDPDAVVGRAGALARLRDRFAPAITGNKGERACREHGVGGARAEAQAGFPHVVDVALPWLRDSRTRGDSESAAQLNALVAVIARLDDTCILSRGGREALGAAQAGAAKVLAAGGVGCRAGRAALRQLESRLLARKVSPGGAADILSATLFVDRVGGAFTKHPPLQGEGWGGDGFKT